MDLKCVFVVRVCGCVGVCVRARNRQTERSHVSPLLLSASPERTQNVICMHYLHDLIK